MPRLIALRQLTGDYGNVIDGQAFDCTDEVAESLLSRGLARRELMRMPPPVIIPKVVEPAENKVIYTARSNKPGNKRTRQ